MKLTWPIIVKLTLCARLKMSGYTTKEIVKVSGFSRKKLSKLFMECGI